MAELPFAIQELIDAGDWETLAGMLANPRKSAELRVQAALALAETQIPEAGEALLEAIFHDPSQLVRDAAFDALKRLVGGETSRLAVESYGEEPAPLGLAEEPEQAEETSGGPHWGINDVVGLTSIISGDSNPAQRIKAINALGEIAHHEAVNYLAYVALWEEDDAVRKAAVSTLRERFGDDLDDFLTEQRAMQGTNEDDLDVLEEEDAEFEADEAGETVPSVARSTYSAMVSGQTVNEEVNPTRGFLLGLAGVAIIAIILYLLFF